MPLIIWRMSKLVGKKNKASMSQKFIRYTFSAAVILVLPSASLADRAPMPTDGKTVQIDIQVRKYF